MSEEKKIIKFVCPNCDGWVMQSIFPMMHDNDLQAMEETCELLDKGYIPKVEVYNENTNQCFCVCEK